MIVAGRELETQLLKARGAGREPTVVLLHEGLGSLGLWRDVPEQLARRTGLAVLTYSRYGNGFSEVLREPRTPRYMHDEALVVLPELLDAHAVRDVVLVGHSDGASIALIFAASHPDRISALVLEAPHVFVEDLSIRSIAAAKRAYEAGDLRTKLARHHRDVDRTFYGWNDIWLDPSFRDWNIETYARDLRCRTLVVQGSDDEYGTPAQIESIRAAASGARIDTLLLANCGHSPHRDHPAPTLDAIASFLTRGG
ncbi:MAG TPA: alpha/beta fold hydrolase [Candidatus Baltobacteraceae bacterium]